VKTKLPTRRVGGPALGDADLIPSGLPDVIPPPERTAEQAGRIVIDELLGELDQLRGRVGVAEQDLKQTAEDLAATAAECDDLSTRSLPHLSAYLTEPFDEPIPDGAPDGDDWPPVALWTRGWPAVHGDKGDDYALTPGLIRDFAAEYAGGK
jgi:hypothetical protein